MRSLAALGEADVSALSGVIFDLDGTVLTDGRLSPEAYAAIVALADAGLTLVVCTGRPAAWGEVVQRQWPVALTVTENGAVAFRRDGHAVDRIDRASVEERDRRRARLLALVERVSAAFPDLVLADDNLGRLSDVTFDIGERQKVTASEVLRIRDFVASIGGRTFESSIHLHVTLDTDDKASGTVFVLGRERGEDASAVLHRYAFIGDSNNDEACFSAFRLTFGVDNIRAHSGRLSKVPRFISRGRCGEGFAEIAERLLALGAGQPSVPS